MNGESHPTPHTGTIVGVSVGSFVLVIALIALFIFYRKNKDKRSKMGKDDDEDTLVGNEKLDTRQVDGTKSVFTLSGLVSTLAHCSFKIPC